MKTLTNKGVMIVGMLISIVTIGILSIIFAFNMRKIDDESIEHNLRSDIELIIEENDERIDEINEIMQYK